MRATDATATDAPTRRPANRRELILEAAVELFHRHGYPATSVDDIGKAVDVSGPAIYRHFSSKEDLLVEAITLAADEVHAVNRGLGPTPTIPVRCLRATSAPTPTSRRAFGTHRRVDLRTSPPQPRAPLPHGRRLRSWTTNGPTPSRPLVPNSDDDAFLLVTAAIGLITAWPPAPTGAMIPTWPRTSSRWHSPPSTLPSASPRRPPVPINPDAVGTVGPENEISWTSKDSLLYALGVGAGQTDPTGFELEFTTENTRKPPSRRSPRRSSSSAAGRVDFGDFNLAALLHGEQHITLHQTLPAEGTAIGQGRAAAIHDKGKAALVVLETDVRDADGNPGGPPAPASSSPAKGLGWRPRAVGHLTLPIVPPTSCTASTPAPTRRCSIASTATATPCTRTRHSPPSPASRPRSCTASARTE